MEINMSHRRQLKRLKTKDDERKLEKDFKRTTQDFYRMELDRLYIMKPESRSSIHRTYNAYLHNTPGSKKAIQECIAIARNKTAKRSNSTKKSETSSE
jgi:hypothetical protein